MKLMTMMKYVREISSLMLLIAFAALGCFASPGVANAQDQDWKASYERLCGSSLEDADDTGAELKGMLGEVEELEKTVEAMDFPQKKNYMFRIKKCKDLIKYYIEIKQSK